MTKPRPPIKKFRSGQLVRSKKPKPEPLPHPNGPVPTPEDDERLIDISETAEEAASVPVNQHLVDRAEAYRHELAVLIGDRNDTTREFMLTEVIPQAMSLTNGLQDSMDVVKLAMDGSFSSGKQVVHTFESLTSLSVYLKILGHISKTMSLTEQEDRILRLIIFSQQTGNSHGADIKTLLREVLALPDRVSRSQERNSGVRMQGLHKTPRSRQHPRDRPDRDDPER